MRVNFTSPERKLIVGEFISEAHWEEARQAMTERGVDFDALAQSQDLSLLRRLGPLVATQRSARSGHKYSSVDAERLETAWQRTVPRLYEEVGKTHEAIEWARYGFCSFGLATPNPSFVEPPLAQALPGGGSIWSETRGRGQTDPYFFHGEGAISRMPELAQHVSFVLLYNERI